MLQPFDEESFESDEDLPGCNYILQDDSPVAWSSYTSDPEHIDLMKETYDEVHSAMESLSSWENTWVRYRFGFDDEPVSLSQAAKDFYLSESRASRLEMDALKRMRKK